MGNRPPESLAQEEARVLEQTRVGWLPPEPKPPPLIDKIHPPGSPEGPWCRIRAAMSSSNKNHPDNELYMNGGGTPSGTSALVSSFLPSLAREEARVLEQTRVSRQPPDPEPPSLIDKIHPPGFPRGPLIPEWWRHP